MSVYKELKTLYNKNLYMIRKRQQLFLIVHINEITLRAIINFEAISNFINHMIVIRYRFKLVKKKRLYYLFALNKDAIGLKNG